MRTNSSTFGSLLLLLAAIIWGGAFIAQSAGMNYIRPFTYSSLRFILGCIVLLPFVLVFRKRNSASKNRLSMKGGLIVGVFLFLGNTFQQYGLTMTSPGKAGFISALYLMIVPLAAYLIFRKRIEKHVWLGIAVAIMGFYFLCIKGELRIETGDFFVLCCAFFFAFQILGVDYYSKLGVDPFIMTFFQFLSTAILSTVFMFIFDDINMSAVFDAKWTILYAGILSGGLTYTIQVYGQKLVEPSVASILMSSESVFATVFEWLIYHTTMPPVELFGCALVFMAVIIVQLPSKKEII